VNCSCIVLLSSELPGDDHSLTRGVVEVPHWIERSPKEDVRMDRRTTPQRDAREERVGPMESSSDNEDVPLVGGLAELMVVQAQPRHDRHAVSAQRHHLLPDGDYGYISSFSVQRSLQIIKHSLQSRINYPF
jgi:hypothetical protein